MHVTPFPEHLVYTTYSPDNAITIKYKDIHLIEQFFLWIREFENVGVECHALGRRRKGTHGTRGKGPNAADGETGEDGGRELHLGDYGSWDTTAQQELVPVVVLLLVAMAIDDFLGQDKEEGYNGQEPTRKNEKTRRYEG